MRQRQNRMPGRRTIDNDIGNRINLRIWEKPHPRLASETPQARFFPDGLFRRFPLGCGFRDFGLLARLLGFFWESAGISLGKTNIGREWCSRLAGLASRAIRSSGSVSYLTPIAR